MLLFQSSITNGLAVGHVYVSQVVVFIICQAHASGLTHYSLPNYSGVH